MKHLLIFLVLVASVIVTPSLASYTCNYGNQSGEITTTQRIIPGFATTADLDAVCMAHCGVASTSNVLTIKATDKTNNGLTNIRTSGYGNYTVSDYYFNLNYAVWYRQVYCDDSKYTGIDNTACGVSAHNNPLYMDVFYKMPLDTNYCAAGTIPVLDVNFTGYPLDGYSPLQVQFTIQNFTYINSTGVSWAFGDGQTVNSTASTINHTYQNPGVYSVSMSGYNITGGSFSITKNNYVLTAIPSGMIVNLDVKSAISPNPLIQDSTVSIRNTSTGVWRNTTAPTGLVYFSTTDPGYLYPLSQNQSITLCANKTGYADACETFAIPYTNYRARLFLMPSSVVNATGTGTVVVNVLSNRNKLTVSGMSVVMDTGQMGITSSAGTVTLYNVTAGNRTVSVTDPDGAYQPTEKTFNLAAGDTELIVVDVVRYGEDPVDTPVSPTVPPVGTYDPNDPNSPVYGNYTTSQINEQGGAGVLGMLYQLIELWPLIIVGVLMKFLKSTFS